MSPTRVAPRSRTVSAKNRSGSVSSFGCRSVATSTTSRPAGSLSTRTYDSSSGKSRNVSSPHSPSTADARRSANTSLPGRGKKSVCDIELTFLEIDHLWVRGQVAASVVHLTRCLGVNGHQRLVPLNGRAKACMQLDAGRRGARCAGEFCQPRESPVVDTGNASVAGRADDVRERRDGRLPHPALRGADGLELSKRG